MGIPKTGSQKFCCWNTHTSEVLKKCDDIWSSQVNVRVDIAEYFKKFKRILVRTGNNFVFHTLLKKS